MSDYIDRQAAINIHNNAIDLWKRQLGEGILIAVKKKVEELPSADVEPVRHGEWIYGEKDGADGWYCSECEFHVPWYYEYYGLDNINFIRDYHTCPHCGAKMLKYTGMESK